MARPTTDRMKSNLPLHVPRSGRSSALPDPDLPLESDPPALATFAPALLPHWFISKESKCFSLASGHSRVSVILLPFGSSQRPGHLRITSTVNAPNFVTCFITWYDTHNSLRKYVYSPQLLLSSPLLVRNETWRMSTICWLVVQPVLQDTAHKLVILSFYLLFLYVWLFSLYTFETLYLFLFWFMTSPPTTNHYPQELQFRCFHVYLSLFR
jgi:hypothetical protein